MSDLESGAGETSRLLPQEQDEEPSSYATNQQSNNRGKRYRDELEVFQTLVGIRFLAKGGGPATGYSQPRPANPLMDIFRPSQAGEDRFRNRGLYDRALSQDLKYRILYTMSNYIIVNLYILQITLAATFTALSAYQENLRVILTILGAVNTVVAGMLAWLTGQGMPIRFRRARDRYREVVKSIESAERSFAEIEYIDWPPGKRPDPVAERDRLDRMYDEARLDQEANYPEVHHDPTIESTNNKNQELASEVENWKEANRKQKQELEVLQEQVKALKGPPKDSGKKDASKAKLVDDE